MTNKDYQYINALVKTYRNKNLKHIKYLYLKIILEWNRKSIYACQNKPSISIYTFLCHYNKDNLIIRRNKSYTIA